MLNNISSQLNQKNEFVDVPNGSKVYQKVKVKVPFHESPQYSSLLNHIDTDRGDLPFVLEAISVVGEMKDMKVRMVTVKNFDGVEVGIIHPTDSIMNGSSTIEQTHNFLTHYILSKIKPAGQKYIDEGIKRKDLNTVIWYRTLPEFENIIFTENKRIRMLSDFFYEKALIKSKDLGVNPYSNKSPLREFKEGKGEIFEEFFSFRGEIYSETISRIKSLSKKVFEEMNIAQEKYKQDNKD